MAKIFIRCVYGQILKIFWTSSAFLNSIFQFFLYKDFSYPLFIILT